MSALTKEKISGVFAEFGGKETNTGSIEGQVALLTERINHISAHLQKNKKDFSTHRGLMAMVARRRKLLDFLIKTAEPRYQAIIAKLGIRK